MGRFEGGITQSPAGVHPGWEPATYRNPRQEYEALGDAATGCGHVPGSGFRSRGLDSRESRANSLSPSQGLVTGTREGLRGPVRGRRRRLEEHFRSSRRWRRSGVLPARAGRQPVFGTRNRAPLLAVFPAHSSSMIAMGPEASLFIYAIGRNISNRERVFIPLAAALPLRAKRFPAIFVWHLGVIAP